MLANPRGLKSGSNDGLSFLLGTRQVQWLPWDSPGYVGGSAGKWVRSGVHLSPVCVTPTPRPGTRGCSRVGSLGVFKVCPPVFMGSFYSVQYQPEASFPPLMWVLLALTVCLVHLPIPPRAACALPLLPCGVSPSAFCFSLLPTHALLSLPLRCLSKRSISSSGSWWPSQGGLCECSRT